MMADDTQDLLRLAEIDVPHPSVFIREERIARGWSKVELAVRMGGEETQTNLLAIDMYENVGPTAPGLRLGQETADDLSRAFDVSAAFFLALEAAWLARAHSTKENTHVG